MSSQPNRASARPRLLLALLWCALAAGCQGGQPRATAATAAERGGYPVAHPPAELALVPVAAPGHYRLLAAGDQVLVRIGGAVVRARLTGPEIDRSGYLPGRPPPTSAPGVVTVVLQAQQGSLRVSAAGFLTLGERRDRVLAHPDRPAVVVSPGHPGLLHLSSVFRAGHTTLTWQPNRTALVTWDFVVELD